MQEFFKKAGLPFVCVIGAALLFGGMLWQLEVRKGTAAILSAHIAASSSKQRAELELEQQARATASGRAAVDSHFLDSNHMAAFLAMIEDLGRRAHATVKVDTVAQEKRSLPLASPQDKKKKPELYNVYVFTVSYQGTWQNAYTFLSSLEHMPYTGVVERLSMEEATAGDVSSGAAGGHIWKGTVVFSIPEL